MKKYEPGPLQLARDVVVGEDVHIDDFVNLYECEIGDESKVDSFVEIGAGVTVGKRCRINTQAYICPGVTIEDDVFIGERVMFTNDKYARAITPSGELSTAADWTLLPTLIKSGAYIGSRVSVLCDITIGKGARVEPGSVVTKDVPDGVTVAGNPAQIVESVAAEE